jgi:ABC-2 type transport system permease protein
MKTIYAALWGEGLKIRKTKVFWITLAFFAFIPSMMSLIFIIQKYPDLISKLGIIGTKASLMQFGEPNWNNYFALLHQAIAAIGLVGFGFVTSWIFGSEYTDKTLKDILALPTPRYSIIIAKILTAVVWSALLSIIFLFTALMLGFIIGITGGGLDIIIENIIKFFSVAGLSILLITPVAFFAAYSKGYFLPLGFIILTLIMANFIGVVGLGPYFPWAIPGIHSIPAGPEAVALKLNSYLILIITSIAGLIGTLAFFHYADQK